MEISENGPGMFDMRKRNYFWKIIRETRSCQEEKRSRNKNHRHYEQVVRSESHQEKNPDQWKSQDNQSVHFMFKKWGDYPERLIKQYQLLKLPALRKGTALSFHSGA